MWVDVTAAIFAVCLAACWVLALCADDSDYWDRFA